MNYWTQSTKNIYVAGHTGWLGKYPENSMEGIRAAIDVGVDQIELDLHAAKGGDIVIIHDETVDRTTNGSGYVCDMTVKELKKLDLGIKRGEEFAGCRIPEFGEFMDLIKDLPTLTVDFELKEYPIGDNEKNAYDFCDRVLAIIDEYKYTDRCVINTWNSKLNEYIFKKYGKKYRQHVYFPPEVMGENTIDPYSYAYCVCMCGESNAYLSKKEEFEEMREKYSIRTWAGAGVRDEATVDEAIEKGAELITCNNPDEILSILRKKGYHK